MQCTHALSPPRIAPHMAATKLRPGRGSYIGAAVLSACKAPHLAAHVVLYGKSRRLLQQQRRLTRGCHSLHAPTQMPRGRQARMDEANDAIQSLGTALEATGATVDAAEWVVQPPTPRIVIFLKHPCSPNVNSTKQEAFPGSGTRLTSCHGACSHNEHILPQYRLCYSAFSHHAAFAAALSPTTPPRDRGPAAPGAAAMPSNS